VVLTILGCLLSSVVTFQMCALLIYREAHSYCAQWKRDRRRHAALRFSTSSTLHLQQQKRDPLPLAPCVTCHAGRHMDSSTYNQEPLCNTHTFERFAHRDREYLPRPSMAPPKPTVADRRDLVNSHFDDPTFSDLRIKLSDRVVHVHRVVLCRGSEYFTYLLAGRFLVSCC
jgi:hypothetical protein